MRIFTIPDWTKGLFPEAVWDIPTTDEQIIYLTFDDGPVAGVTDFVLDELAKVNARATFFCVGENIDRSPALFDRIRKEGHAQGSHTNCHLDGWKTGTDEYVKDTLLAADKTNSKLFRPPYGRLRPAQYNRLRKEGLEVVFWSVLSYDFDKKLAPEDRIEKTLKLTKNGSIVVFHDSEKAAPQLKKELPILLNKWVEAGYGFKAIRL